MTIIYAFMILIDIMIVTTISSNKTTNRLKLKMEVHKFIMYKTRNKIMSKLSFFYNLVILLRHLGIIIQNLLV